MLKPPSPGPQNMTFFWKYNQVKSEVISVSLNLIMMSVLIKRGDWNTEGETQRECHVNVKADMSASRGHRR